jgi:hypothetical protein
MPEVSHTHVVKIPYDAVVSTMQHIKVSKNGGDKVQLAGHRRNVLALNTP